MQDKLTQVAEEYLRGQGMELIELKVGRHRLGPTIMLVIDRPGHVTIEDCVMVHKELGWILKTEDVVDGEVRLNVSSPGPRRALRIPVDLVKFTGEPVRLVLHRPINGLNVVTGTLEQVDTDHVTVLYGDKPRIIRIVDIKHANLWR